MKKPRCVRSQRHMCMNIDGVLKHEKKITYFDDENGKRITDKEARIYLNTCLAEGKRVIPIGNCYRFDFQKGCKGHIKALEPTEDAADEIELEWALFKQGKRL